MSHSFEEFRRYYKGQRLENLVLVELVRREKELYCYSGNEEEGN